MLEVRDGAFRAGILLALGFFAATAALMAHSPWWRAAAALGAAVAFVLMRRFYPRITIAKMRPGETIVQYIERVKTETGPKTRPDPDRKIVEKEEQDDT